MLRYGRGTGERPVRSISPEKMLSVITGELGGVAPVEAASSRLKVRPAGLFGLEPAPSSTTCGTNGKMAQIEKLIAAMRRNPRADWRIGQLKAIADRYGFAHRQQGTSHVTFRPPRGDKLPVPARRPIKPVHIRKLLALIDAQETTHGDQA